MKPFVKMSSYRYSLRRRGLCFSLLHGDKLARELVTDAQGAVTRSD